MKKNDIIQQKLFETCKLSEFYLNLLKDEDESPMQLAHAYKQKLYEIVDRYDRLLELNKQRRHDYDLDLELKQTNLSLANKTSTPFKTSTSNLITTPIGSGHMPISILTSSSSTNLPPNSNCSSYASTPATTPGHSSTRSSFGTYTRGGSTRSIYSQANQQHHYSNKQMQNRFDYLYADTTDEEEDDESDDDQSFYGYTKPHNLKCQLEYDSYGKVSSDGSDEEKSDNNNNGMLSLQYNNSKNIEKSYSNLSKDSGVFGESYHSECGYTSNNNKTRLSEGADQNESTEERISDEDNTFEENLTSPATSNTSSSNNKYSTTNDNNTDTSTSPTNNFYQIPTETSTPKPKPKTPDSFIWGSVTQLVESEPHTKTIPKLEIELTPPRPCKPPVKPKFFLNKLQTSEQPNLLKSSLNNSLLKQTNNYQLRKFHNNNPSNIDVDNPNLMSMVVGQNGEIIEQVQNYSVNNNPPDVDEGKAANSSFIFNYNSLMNVSMLDNIQATNGNNSEVDSSMTSSILMFN